MKLIVGLGNPGKEYENTRHNVGFMVIDEYCNAEKFQAKFNGLYLTKIIADEKVIFLKPQSFMNLSGDVVSKYASYYKIDKNDILVIRDDLDLPIGTAKIKYNSSSGGDNGIKSIIERLHTQEFTQFKIGISNDKIINTTDYVLGNFSKSEKDKLKVIIDKSGEVIDTFIKSGAFDTMNKYNGILK